MPTLGLAGCPHTCTVLCSTHERAYCKGWVFCVLVLMAFTLNMKTSRGHASVRVTANALISPISKSSNRERMIAYGFTTVSPYVLCTDVEIMVEMTDVRPVGLRYRPSRPVKAALVNAERHPWLPSAEVTSEVNRMAFYFSAANAAHWSPPAEAALTPCTKSLRVTPSGV